MAPTDFVALGLAWYVVFVFSVTVHEAAHALLAMKLGDPTAYHGGQVTLDPVPHMRREPFGMIVVPLLSYVLGGWMFGWASTPYDPGWVARHPRRAAWMGLAGPGGNLALILLAGVLIHAGIAAGWFYAPPAITFSTVVEARAVGPAKAAAVRSRAKRLSSRCRRRIPSRAARAMRRMDSAESAAVSLKTLFASALRPMPPRPP